MHMHTGLEGERGLYVHSAFLCISLSPKNAFPHTPTTTEPLRCLERTIAHAILEVKGLLFQCGSQLSGQQRDRLCAYVRVC